MMKNSKEVLSSLLKTTQMGQLGIRSVLDVSMNWNGTALCGDADFPAVSSIVDAITPVPGGVGAVTSAVLMAHTVRAAEYLTGGGGA